MVKSKQMAKEKKVLDEEKVSTWMRGQIKLDNGDIVTFEFSPDGEHGGGKVDVEPAEGNQSLIVTHKDVFTDASGILGTQIIKFLRSAKTMFSLVSAPAVPGMPEQPLIMKPREGSER